ncbi:ABC transporter ATP-binding protein [Lutibacter sp. B2]|nr:ABC transporter ATP-binding protein [Lutibacter sp. B2]
MDKKPVIHIQNLRKSYEKKEVLKGIDLLVYPGQIIGYIGSNGAGKSTTVKILLGIINEYEGQIEIFGQDIRKDAITYKKRIGYVPENGEIYDNLTAAEYLAFLGQMYDMKDEAVERKSKHLMKLFGIESYYNTRINTYSKGMKQKLLIIASMIHNPDILFLDEPLSGLDANTVLVLKEIMAALAKQGKTIFYSSHIMEVVEKISDRILLLNEGQIVADGNFEELKEKNKEGTLEKIFNELTGFKEHRGIADEFVTLIEEDEE